MDLLLLSKKLLQDLDEIKIQNLTILEKAHQSIKVCRNVLWVFKKKVLSKGFKTIKDEIKFFKEVKQVPLIQLIYFSEIYSFEIQLPKGDKHSQLKAIKKKINKFNRFFLYNIDFGRYINSGATHFDKEYYTRDYLDTFHITTSKFYFQDPEFCTPRDMLLGKYRAYYSLVHYMAEKKRSLKNNLNGKSIINEPIEKLHWPFSNTDYVEFVYALCAKGLGKKDNQSIMQVSKKLQQLFDFEPKDIYKTYQDIKNRKNSRTLFLDQLSTSLIIEMDKSEV
ncbi:RteC domain-containing protein [Maribacter ulvicola]|uniref:RteC protein n=1 Tax=Maribacter ulvicola TaxID=228959 RepID=A0A1N6QB74_9FLAO|nr:RteC domain-containing protein [Maribacter ulvicola]SIQ13827.1 RteC protein [Maribacter ulvicola]